MLQPIGQLFGKSLKHEKFPHFELSEGVYTSKTITPSHSHDWALLCIVLKGSYTENRGASLYTRQPSTVFFHPAGETHASDFSRTKVVIFRIEINPERLAQLNYRTGIFENPLDFQGGATFLLATKIYREFNLMDEASPIAIEGLILELLAQAVRSVRMREGRRQAIPTWLKEAKNFLRDNFSENHSLDTVAAQVGIGPCYLATEFRHRYGLTIGEYVRRLRVEFACHKLSGSNVPLVEIALGAGFCSQSHFTRTFKSMTGFTPARYRLVSRRP